MSLYGWVSRTSPVSTCLMCRRCSLRSPIPPRAAIQRHHWIAPSVVSSGSLGSCHIVPSGGVYSNLHLVLITPAHCVSPDPATGRINTSIPPLSKVSHCSMGESLRPLSSSLILCASGTLCTHSFRCLWVLRVVAGSPLVLSCLVASVSCRMVPSGDVSSIMRLILIVLACHLPLNPALGCVSISIPLLTGVTCHSIGGHPGRLLSSFILYAGYTRCDSLCHCLYFLTVL